MSRDQLSRRGRRLLDRLSQPSSAAGLAALLAFLVILAPARGQRRGKVLNTTSPREPSHCTCRLIQGKFSGSALLHGTWLHRKFRQERHS